MKPFDLEAAKAGKPVVTRCGFSARILCFDRKSTSFPIIALVNVGEEENLRSFAPTGAQSCGDTVGDYDLFMGPVKKYVVIGVCASDGKAFTASAGAIYDCKDDALAYAKRVTQQHAGTYQVVEIES